uniref:Uncharacterized protein n=1 Tax=Romanomermis culicivorax TaxID=13658 RepID=A0A915KIQ0_ROMCU
MKSDLCEHTSNSNRIKIYEHPSIPGDDAVATDGAEFSRSIRLRRLLIISEIFSLSSCSSRLLPESCSKFLSANDVETVRRPLNWTLSAASANSCDWICVRPWNRYRVEPNRRNFFLGGVSGVSDKSTHSVESNISNVVTRSIPYFPALPVARRKFFCKIGINSKTITNIPVDFFN